ncbi:hypothetical protein [Winogradskyella sp. UBA3174]|uniref:hypothetical protein n=1 Tax=Winogradskyella sp. UBA3174 TaxID=1947785 RepID=UPI0025F377C6|nr:hypothetical protein [Winogradskyella sp. UBA3174]|tara:strand:+ start:1184 stop:1714 length:531 start_codon:yes stop_codon:yes gene_type:complete
MKNKYIILLIFLFTGTKVSFAQDGVFKSKKIEISFTEINQKDSLLSIEFYQNGIFSTNESGTMGYRSNSNYDSLTNIYTLRYSYTGIGGGSDNRLGCPLLFVKLNFITEDIKEYFQLIPIVLQICGTSQLHEIKVLDIDLNGLIEQADKMILVNENNTYQVVANKELKMGKLVKIE